MGRIGAGSLEAARRSNGQKRAFALVSFSLGGKEQGPPGLLGVKAFSGIQGCDGLSGLERDEWPPLASGATLLKPP